MDHILVKLADFFFKAAVMLHKTTLCLDYWEVKALVTLVAVIRSIKLKGTGKGFGDRLKHVLGTGLRG